MKALILCFAILFISIAQSQNSQQIYKNMLSKDKSTQMEAIRLGLLSSDAVLQEHAVLVVSRLQLQEQQKFISILLEIHTKVQEEIREGILYILSMFLPKTPAVMEVLKNTLENGTAKEREAILTGLTVTRKEAHFALPSMLKIYPKMDNNIRLLILDRLASIDSHDIPVLNLLKAALKEKDSSFKAKAAYALGEIGEKDFGMISLLKENLSDSDPLVIAESAEALGKLLEKREESFIRIQEEISQILWKLRESEDSQVRISSMLAFSKMDKKRKDSAIAVLFKDMANEDAFISFQAVRAILSIDSKNKAAIRVLLKIAKSGYYADATTFMVQIALDNEEIMDFLKSQASKTENLLSQRIQALYVLSYVNRKTENSLRSFFQDIYREEQNQRIKEFLEKILKK